MDESLATVAELSAKPKTLPWVLIGVLGIVLLLWFAPVLWTMGKEWAEDENMGHGFFVPVVAGYIAWQRREDLVKIEPKPSWFGWLLLGWAGFQVIIGTLGADFFLQRTAFIAALLGLLLATVGWHVLKVLALPLFLLLFMIRIPLFIYSQITFPLQILASQLAEISLNILDIPVLREGNVLELASQKLQVVEACSGIRSLLSLSFLGLVYAYFFESRNWMRVVIFLSTMPIAIAANAFRITLTGIISEWRKEFAEGIYHSFEGWVIFMVSLVALLAVHGILKLLANLFTSKGNPDELVVQE